ncbi:MAG: HAD-IA family hydrolase, partial [Verrucomicrobia bacterium]|nr:HAD-IA family hydrolase [Verrucomicrobiota bacterium]
SAPESVAAMLRHAVGGDTAARFSFVLGGDVVARKKPAPDIYLLAAQRFGAAPGDCVVIEDSNNGLVAAKAAGMACIVTVSGYTADEDFSSADLVLSCLGDPAGERALVLANRSAARPAGWLRAEDLRRFVVEP